MYSLMEAVQRPRSEGAAGVGIAIIVPPAAAQRQQLTLRSERLEPIAEASEKTRAHK